MKALLLTLTLIQLCFASIRPSPEAPLMNDPYFSYQWSHLNQGQIVISDIDDITPIETIGQSKAAIDWSPELDSLMKKTTVVAVIDSGLDLNHEDLQDKIFYNEKECIDGKVPLNAPNDLDQNGFEGDCAGWNFATPDKKQARFVTDDIGHGTHVAGIMAANINNQIGISGLSNKIKILPLKVYDKRETTGFQRETISERVAKAIDYAVLRGVDVINLSLGWPSIGNTPKIISSLKNASEKGIFIVAAAGNDRHEAQVYPCAFEEVFCVGSINNDLSISRFSNFGGHVDILAPGGQILSLIPSTISSDFFGIKGYDIKFGTSQAAPFVSGAVAIIKGIFPSLSQLEIKDSLMKSSLRLSQDFPFTQSGLIQITKTIQAIKDGKIMLLRPSFKEVSFVEVDAKNLKGSFNIKLNRGLTKTDKIFISSHHPQIKLKLAQKNDSLQIDLASSSDWVDSKLDFTLTLNGERFRHQLQVAKKITADNSNFYEIQQPIDVKNFSTIPAPQVLQTQPEFFSFSKDEKKLEVFQLDKNQLRLKHRFNLDQVDELISNFGVIRVLINEDQKLDYWISGFKKDDQGNASELRYYFFDSEGKKLNQFDDQMSYEVISDFSFPSPLSTRFLKVSTPKLGTFYMPVSIAKGNVEKIDQNQDPFEVNPSLPGTHLTYLWPEINDQKIHWKLRTFTNDQTQKKIKQSLRLPTWMEFDLLTIKNSDPTKITVLFRTGTSQNEKNYFWDLNSHHFEIHAERSSLFFKPEEIRPIYTSLSFLNQAFDNGIQLKDQELTTTLILKGQFSKDRYRVLNIEEDKVFSLAYKTSDPREFISSLIKFFSLKDKTISIFELDTELEISMDSDEGKKVFSTSLYRSSFIQGTKFSLRFQALTALNPEGELIPTIYVDNSKLYHSTLQMWAIEQDKIFTPLKFSYSIPKNCLSLNPAWEKNQTSAVIYCRPDQSTPLETIRTVRF